MNPTFTPLPTNQPSPTGVQSTTPTVAAPDKGGTGVLGFLSNVTGIGKNPFPDFVPLTSPPDQVNGPQLPHSPFVVPKIPPTITTDATNPESPLSVPTNTPSTAQGSLTATANSYMTPPPNSTVNNGVATANPPPAPESSPYQDALRTMLSDTNSLGQKSDVTNQLNTQFGVDQKQQNYIDAYNQYNSKKLAYDQQVQSIYNTPGITREQAQQQVSEVSRINNADLANLAVIAQAAQGNLQGALDIVKRKVDAQFDPIQTRIDNLGKFIQLNNANLSDSEKTQLENQRFQLQNNLDQLKTAKMSAHQFALQQGITDPNILNAIDAAQTPTDAYAAVNGTNGQLPGSNATNVQGNVSQNIATNVNQQNQQYIDYSSDGVPYVDQGRLQNMTPYQKQIASQQFASAGVRVLDPQDVSALTTIDEAKQNLKLFESAANGLLSSGLLGRIKGYTTNQLAQLAQTNPEWRQFQTLRTGLIKSVQGAAAGAPGLRVTGVELSNAAEALPNSYDNKESAQKAVDTFRTQLNINRNILLRGSAPTGNQNNNSNNTGNVSIGGAKFIQGANGKWVVSK